MGGVKYDIEDELGTAVEGVEKHGEGGMNGLVRWYGDMCRLLEDVEMYPGEGWRFWEEDWDKRKGVGLRVGVG